MVWFVLIPDPRMIQKLGQHKINEKMAPLAGLPALVPTVIIFELTFKKSLQIPTNNFLKKNSTLAISLFFLDSISIPSELMQ